MLRVVLGHRARGLGWLRALDVRCIRRGRFLVVQVEVREDRALRHGRDLVRVDLGLGIGRELLRVG
jgi:hypothetical protein